MATLDERLLTASQMIIPYRPVADIGTDHGCLPVYLIESSLAPWVIATECGDGPLKRACQYIGKSACADRIELRRGDGLQVLQKGEVETVVIMGLGGDLIADLLSRDWDLTASFMRLVLQPMTRAGVVRRLLARQGWPLLGEKVVRVKRRFFVLLSYQPGSRPYELTRLEEEVGPHILKARTEPEREYRVHCLLKLKRVWQALGLSKQPYDQNQRNEYARLCRELEEIIDDNQG